MSLHRVAPFVALAMVACGDIAADVRDASMAAPDSTPEAGSASTCIPSDAGAPFDAAPYDAGIYEIWAGDAQCDLPAACPPTPPTDCTPCGTPASCRYGNRLDPDCATTVLCAADDAGVLHWKVNGPRRSCTPLLTGGACPTALDAGGGACDTQGTKCVVEGSWCECVRSNPNTTVWSCEPLDPKCPPFGGYWWRGCACESYVKTCPYAQNCIAVCSDLGTYELVCPPG